MLAVGVRAGRIHELFEVLIVKDQTVQLKSINEVEKRHSGQRKAEVPRAGDAQDRDRALTL